ncbi:hypothetical protein [Kitasatospora sp. SUK 42]|uniref:hypothetical protein n=1 Tax=Kitasatospora sp. SUK 42 TaxID=1588882 RepID=UPI0018CB7E3E|nr:hypothetical protein [Kitasatospora sp. SUK 42]MBV2152416.1 hypothetical protein [Kitasatospora sp. SUK 42]
MRTAIVPPPRSPRMGRGWYLAAVLSAVLAVGMCLLGWRQAVQADRIGAHPVRVEGVITQLPTGGGTYSAVSYRAGGQPHTAAALPLADGARVGDAVCLEHAADDPDAVRVCGDTYPQPVGIGLARFSVPVAAVAFVICMLRIRRHWRAVAVRSGQGRLAANLALATGALADGMPAITHGKRSRRRRRAGGRRGLH